MAFERLQVELAMLINEMTEKPEDLHEIQDKVHQKLAELKALGQPLPADLVEFEQKLVRDFPKPAAKKA